MIVATKNSLARSAFLVVGVALALSACAAPSPELTEAGKDEMYTALVEAQGVDIPAGLDLPRAGRVICDYLDDYSSVLSIGMLYTAFVDEHEMDPGLVSAMMAPAPGAYCPEHSDEMGAWIASL